MTQRAPWISIYANRADVDFAREIAARLAARGLDVSFAHDAEPGGDDPNVAAALVVISPNTMLAPDALGAYRNALPAGCPVIPVLLGPASLLPPDLADLQAADFSGSREDGWDALLVALDSLHLARYPVQTPPVLDPEIVVARVRTGRYPASWSVARSLVNGKRRPLREFYWGAAVALLALPFGIAVGMSDATAPLMTTGLLLVCAAVAWGRLYSGFCPHVRQYDKRGTFVAITDDGLVTRAPSQVVYAAFTEARLPGDEAASTPESVRVIVRVLGHNAAQERTLAGYLGSNGTIAEQALRAAMRYAARWGGAPDAMRAQNGDATRTTPTVFLSYARADAAIADRIDQILTQFGFAVWMDRSNLRGGAPWQDRIQHALANAAAVVVLVSPAAMRSAAVASEYRYALGAGIPVLGVRIRTTRRIAPDLREHIHADASELLLNGLLDLVPELLERGVTPTGSSDATDTSAIQLTVTLAASAAIHGSESGMPGVRVFRGRPPLTYFSSVGLLVAFLFGSAGFSAVYDSLFPIAVFAVTLAPFIPTTVLFLRRRLRAPDLVILTQDGYGMYTQGLHMTTWPYRSLGGMSVGAPTKDGLPIVQHPRGLTQIQTAIIPRTIRERRAIAESIVRDCAAYARRAGEAAAYAPAKAARAETADGNP